MFPFPTDPRNLFEDGEVWFGEFSSHEIGILYDNDTKSYSISGIGVKKSLKEILQDNLKHYEIDENINYTPTQKKVFEDYKRLVIQPLK